MLNVLHLINVLGYICGIIYSKEEVINMADIKKTKEKQISLDLNEIVTVNSTDHPEASIVIKNSKGRLMVTINDTQEKKK